MTSPLLLRMTKSIAVWFLFATTAITIGAIGGRIVASPGEPAVAIVVASSPDSSTLVFRAVSTGRTYAVESATASDSRYKVGAEVLIYYNRIEPTTWDFRRGDASFETGVAMLVAAGVVAVLVSVYAVVDACNEFDCLGELRRTPQMQQQMQQQQMTMFDDVELLTATVSLPSRLWEEDKIAIGLSDGDKGRIVVVHHP